jgi:D-glucosaminate-6-phosphate ammonia-lyase
MANFSFQGLRNLRAAFNRRDFFRTGGVLTMAGAIPPSASAALAKAMAKPTDGRDHSALYENIGVRPIINARGTFTILTGSQSLPQVKDAMIEASRSYVQMDELMAGVSKKLAELTGAPWGIVTAGCCAALTNFTAAVIAGTNPERMQRLPNLEGLKNEVIIPEYSRNVYDHAIRMLGVKVVEVKTPAELASAFNERTALIYIFAGPGDEGPLGTKAVCDIARPHQVPVIVDAAAEGLTFPNLHLQRGATAVAYSGGKCLKGPQAAGLLLGDKNLLQAAWANSAPHHAFGRSLKVGKEEIMGMLAAVEAWKTRDHDAEYRDWEAQLGYISKEVTKVPGVTARVEEPQGLSNRTPSLRIEWDASQLGITGQEVSKMLMESEPRIALGGASGVRPDRMNSSVTVTPWMMMPGDHKIVASRISSVLSDHPPFTNPPVPSGELASLAGQWRTTLTFSRGSAEHRLVFEQHEASLVGTHYGEFGQGDLTGSVTANQVHFRSAQKIEGQRLSYGFSGTVNGDTMSGVLDMGEYGLAEWSAERHHYEMPNGQAKPVKKA